MDIQSQFGVSLSPNSAAFVHGRVGKTCKCFGGGFAALHSFSFSRDDRLRGGSMKSLGQVRLNTIARALVVGTLLLLLRVNDTKAQVGCPPGSCYYLLPGGGGAYSCTPPDGCIDTYWCNCNEGPNSCFWDYSC